MLLRSHPVTNSVRAYGVVAPSHSIVTADMTAAIPDQLLVGKAEKRKRGSGKWGAPTADMRVWFRPQYMRLRGRRRSHSWSADRAVQIWEHDSVNMLVVGLRRIFQHGAR